MTVRRSRRRPGENRARLLEAGIVEFSRRGFHGASTAAIADRAGVPQPHVYVHFPSKIGLFRVCVEVAFTALENLIIDARLPQPSVVLQGDLPTAVYRALHVQAVVSLADSELRAEVEPLLNQLREHLGEGEWRRLLNAGFTELSAPLADER